MKKVLFLMFLLLLIGLGAASVKAQVRIGGNAAPNASALLDLNATDATMNGTKGLALPRVDLTSPTMLLSGVTSNLTGMMVYNTTTTLGAIGIYYWNGATWVRASLPSTTPADSGKVLRVNSAGVVVWSTTIPGSIHGDTVRTAMTPKPVTWTLVADTALRIIIPPYSNGLLQIAGVSSMDVCTSDLSTNFYTLLTATPGGVLIQNNYNFGIWNVTPGKKYRIRCFHPSF